MSIHVAATPEDEGEDQGLQDNLPILPSALHSITKAEIDSSIQTAKLYPRSIQKFLQDCKTLVAIDPELAKSCTYILPGRKKKDEVTGKLVPISGPSVRLAEVIRYGWTNLSIGARIVEDDGRFVTAQAVAIDAERNRREVNEVKRQVVDNKGCRFSDEMVKTTCMAAMAIAKRNATFDIVPRSLVRMIQAEAVKIAVGDVKTLGAKTEAAIAYFAELGATADQIWKCLGIAGPGDMTLDLLTMLHGYATAIKEGHATAAEIFADLEQNGNSNGRTNGNGGTRAQQTADRIKGAKPADTSSPPVAEPPPPAQGPARAAVAEMFPTTGPGPEESSPKSTTKGRRQAGDPDENLASHPADA